MLLLKEQCSDGVWYFFLGKHGANGSNTQRTSPRNAVVHHPIVDDTLLVHMYSTGKNKGRECA